MTIVCAQRDDLQMAVEAKAPHRSTQNERMPLPQLVEQHLPAIYRFHYRLCRDVHEAEDRTQTTFLRAVRGFHTFKPGTNFRAWVYRIAANVAADAAGASKDVLTLDESTEPVAPAAHDAVEGADLRAALDAEVAALPPALGAVLVMRVHQDLPHAEIAQSLGVTEEVVRWRLWKARTILRERLARHLA